MSIELDYSSYCLAICCVNICSSHSILVCYLMHVLLEYLNLLVDALQQIATTIGAIYWKFNGDACRIEMVGLTEKPPEESESTTECECHFENNTVCHVVRLVLKRHLLTPELVKLPYLREIDFAYNYLNDLFLLIAYRGKFQRIGKYNYSQVPVP
ncbi:probable LRR receptor-like serine/threonine-protein kinase RFK1 [Rosa chinensis]|uniref:probable LRR receptor-like serine/threonine-protein kinase RFK1 n=1 Tax=Rosa chinensis TaxID=74649 RepID=UPI000D0970CD|nr:probable LRR receptor-like serine/threonine-protein kinase RFK1 [Rosa chinensis]